MIPDKHLRFARDLLGKRALEEDMLRLSEHRLLAGLANAALPDRMRQLAVLLGRALDLRRDDLARHVRPDPAPETGV